jgi:hypothetical protein
VDTNRPDTDRGSGSGSGQPRRPPCPVPQLPRHRPRVRLPGRLGPDGGRPTAAVPAPRQRRTGCACSSALVEWAESTRPTDRGCPDGWTADAACRTPGARTPPALWTPATAAGACGHCGSGHAGQPAADPSATVAMSDRNGTTFCGTGQHPPDHQIRRLVLSVHPVRLSAVCAAQVRCRIQPSRQSPVWLWLVD